MTSEITSKTPLRISNTVTTYLLDFNDDPNEQKFLHVSCTDD